MCVIVQKHASIHDRRRTNTSVEIAPTVLKTLPASPRKPQGSYWPIGCSPPPPAEIAEWGMLLSTRSPREKEAELWGLFERERCMNTKATRLFITSGKGSGVFSFIERASLARFLAKASEGGERSRRRRAREEGKRSARFSLSSNGQKMPVARAHISKDYLGRGVGW